MIETLAEIKECACKALGVPTSQSFPQARSREVDLPPRTFAVYLTLSKLNPSAKAEAGLVAPDVHYAGWTSFSRYGKNGPRTPIDFIEKWYLPPEGATGFSYTCRVGYAADLLVMHYT